MVFDGQALFQNLIQNIPVWTILLLLLNYWVGKFKEHQKILEEKLDKIDQRLYEIDIAIAGSGLKDIRGEVDGLAQLHRENEASVKALWKFVELPSKKSRNHEN